MTKRREYLLEKQRKQIAHRFVSYRENALLTQGQMGALLGITRQSLIKIEKGRRMPRVGVVRKFEALEAKVRR